MVSTFPSAQEQQALEQERAEAAAEAEKRKNSKDENSNPRDTATFRCWSPLYDS